MPHPRPAFICCCLPLLALAALFAGAPARACAANQAAEAGEKVTCLRDNQNCSAGQYNSVYWNGYNAAGNMVASGIYIVLLQAPGYQETGKIAVIK